MEITLHCAAYAIFCVAYSIIGGYFINCGIEAVKKGEYFNAGCSFLLVVPQITLLVRATWRL